MKQFQGQKPCVQIASKVDLYVGSLTGNDTEVAQCRWRRLGSMSFDANEGSGHQARELKSAHVDTHAHFVRIVLHQCQANKFNTANQV